MHGLLAQQYSLTTARHVGEHRVDDQWAVPVEVPPGSLALLGSTALLLLVVRLWRRARESGEWRAWRWMLSGVLVIALASGAAAVLDLRVDLRVDLPSATIVDAGCILASLAFYQGLIRWNRAHTLTSDPGDWLNGLSSVLVLTAVIDLLTGAGAPALGLAPGRPSELQLVACAAVLVLLGTTASVSVIGGMIRDVRVWLVAGALATVAVAEVAEVVLGDTARAAGQGVWLPAAATVALCARITPRAGAPRPATNRSTIVGALVVLVCGLAVLTVNTGLFFPVDHAVTAYAAVGSLGAGVRIVRLVQDLAHLTETRYQALTDELTGIANRRALLSAIEVSLRARPATLLIIDLDRFKIINDRYGHAAGDRLLRQAAATFALSVPEHALLARLGGDEFAVLITSGTAEEAVALARVLARDPVTIDDGQGRTLPVRASVGVATTAAGTAGSDLLHRADAAMYQAKTSHSGICVYDGRLDAIAQERLELIEDLHLALAAPDGDGQIVVHFQPQREVATGHVVGAEALARWQHPRLGLLTPDRFVDLAEENGLMNRLTACVMTRAAEQHRRWQEAGHRLRVSVNLSASGLGHPDTLALVDQVLAQGLPPELLVLEVTETSLMVDPCQALAAMNRIAERGVGVSIDDYGTGYSSLSYLNDLPAIELKIDRAFIVRMLTDPKTAAIVAGTVELAHRLGMRLVAEGVEDEATLAVLADLGCDETQGFLHSTALDSEVFLDWLAGCPDAIRAARLRPPQPAATVGEPAASQIPVQRA